MAKVKKKRICIETVLPTSSEIFTNCSFIDKRKERIWQILERLLRLLPKSKHFIGFPGAPVVKKKKKKKSACQCRRSKRLGFHRWVGKIPYGGKCQPTSVFLLGIFHGQRSLAGYNPRGCKELDKNEHTHTHTRTSH